MDAQQVTTQVPPPQATQVRRGGFFTGIGFLLRGFAAYGRSGRIMMLGLVPALITFVVLVGAFVAMFFYVRDVVDWITPYMNSWPSQVAELARGAIELVVVLVWTVLSVLVYVALTLIIGQPFYEAISKKIDDQHGGVPGEINVSFWRLLPRTVIEWIRLTLLAILVSIGVFVIGLIPVGGQIAAFVLEALLAGWILALEVTSVPFERRGMHFHARRTVLRKHRSMAVGFGAATFVTFLIPLGAAFFMPAAVAGATLMARRMHPGG